MVASPIRSNQVQLSRGERCDRHSHSLPLQVERCSPSLMMSSSKIFYKSPLNWSSGMYSSISHNQFASAINGRYCSQVIEAVSCQFDLVVFENKKHFKSTHFHTCIPHSSHFVPSHVLASRLVFVAHTCRRPFF